MSFAHPRELQARVRARQPGSYSVKDNMPLTH